MSAHATRFFGQPTPEHRGPSFAVSIAITAALFAFALAAMRTLPDLAIGSHSRRERPIEIRLPPIVLPTPSVEPAPKNEPTTSRARPSAPTSVPATIVAPVAPVAPPISAPITIPTTIPPASRDSNTAGVRNATSAADAALRSTLRPGASGIGAPAVPAWTKSKEVVGNTPVERDSILRAKMVQIPGLWKTHLPTGAEKAELEASQLAAQMLRARSTTGGNSRDLIHLQGKGKDGVGAVSAPGLVSIPFPLFSPGPSPEQRKKNEALDADYQARLQRLGDSVLIKRDRRIADSLRLDSLRRDSLARRPKVPSPDSVARY